MIYLCELNDGRRYLQDVFKTEQEFTLYLAGRTYAYVLDHQRLTATDIYCRRAYIYDTGQKVLQKHERNLQILDEYGRILDVRDFKHFIPVEPSSTRPPKPYKSKRQGRTHCKWGHYKYLHKFVSRDSELQNVDIRLRHRNRLLRGTEKDYYCESWVSTENNWKSQKVRHQYMWHKPVHKDSYLVDTNAA